MIPIKDEWNYINLKTKIWFKYINDFICMSQFHEQHPLWTNYCLTFKTLSLPANMDSSAMD